MIPNKIQPWHLTTWVTHSIHLPSFLLVSSWRLSVIHSLTTSGRKILSIFLVHTKISPYVSYSHTLLPLPSLLSPKSVGSRACHTASTNFGLYADMDSTSKVRLKDLPGFSFRQIWAQHPNLNQYNQYNGRLLSRCY